MTSVLCEVEAVALTGMHLSVLGICLARTLRVMSGFFRIMNVLQGQSLPAANMKKVKTLDNSTDDGSH